MDVCVVVNVTVNVGVNVAVSICPFMYACVRVSQCGCANLPVYVCMCACKGVNGRRCDCEW